MPAPGTIPAAVLAAVLVASPLLAPGAAHAAPLTDPQAQPQVIDAPASAGSTLERTLDVDTDAGQRNVELLLETRAEGEHVPLPGTRRPLPGSPEAAASAGNRSFDPTPIAPVDPGASDRAAEVRVLRAAAQFVREHRLWLLGALALVAVVAVVARVWQHRRLGASEAQLRQLAEQQRTPRRRRRSSRH